MTEKKIDDHRLVPVEYSKDVVISSTAGLEDVLLWRALHKIQDGFFVDVGAGDPNWGSPTRWFYANGWTGINVEPHPLMFPILEAWRPKDINLNCGVSDTEGEISFYKVDPTALGVAWGLSSFDPESAAQARANGYKVEEITVSTRRLDRIIDEYAPGRTIDLLKIDVEGYEQLVISSLDFKKTRPRVLCIEATAPCSPVPTFSKWEPMLILAGYHFAYFDGINNYYVRAESPELRSQFNCGLNSSDRYRAATSADMKEPWL